MHIEYHKAKRYVKHILRVFNCALHYSMNMNQNSIADIKLIGEKALRRSPEIEMERHRALSDMLHHNRFVVKGHETRQPYHIELEITQHTLVINVKDSAGKELEKIHIGLKSLRKIIKDYFMMCDSFYKMMRTNDRAKMEAVDMGRRAIHNEGAEILMQMLEKYAECDRLTARQLFTLVCVLHIRITNL